MVNAIERRPGVPAPPGETAHVAALAKEEAKRQKLRKTSGAAKPTPEDPVEMLRRTVAPVTLPDTFELQDLPGMDQMALMIFRRDEAGQLVAYAVDRDGNSASAAARRVLQRIRAADTTKKEDPEAD